MLDACRLGASSAAALMQVGGSVLRMGAAPQGNGWRCGARSWTIARMESTGAFPAKRALLVAGLAVWVVAYVAWSTDWLLQPMPYMLERALRRIPVCAAGFALSWMLLRPLRASAGRAFMERFALALALCVGASFLQALIDELVFYVVAPRWGAARWIDLPLQMMTVFWVFAAWVTLYFAIEYDAEAQQSRVRLADVQAAALEAQHRALMSQINPHFIFNALNTVSGLIMEGGADQADRTVLSLARLMRRSLDGDPPPFRTLAAEIGAQLDFIDVQRARFGERFHLTVDKSPDVDGFSVPSLILQPPIENVFTHGLARSEGEVTLSLRARRESDRLVIDVIDDAVPSNRPAAATTGLGLSNVRQRLQLLYDGAASITHGPRAEGGYAVTITLPERP